MIPAPHLHWSTDPLLVDSVPLVKNTWRTANDLLENDQREKIFTITGQFQLYSIIVRKIDFITGVRILQSFPYILLDDKWLKNLRKNTLSLAERAYYYFEGTKADHSIHFWQKKIITYLDEQKRLPFPLFRLSDDWLTFSRRKEVISFQSARGEDFQLPLYLTEELAYLTGVIMGDGHLAKYAIYIVDYHEEYIKQLGDKLSQLFKADVLLYPHKQCNAFMLCQKSKWLIRLFNFISEQPIAKKKYKSLREPKLFSLSNTNPLRLRSAYWRGLMDADGGYKSTIGFGSASKQLVDDFSSFLTQHFIQHRFYTQKAFNGTTYILNVAGNSRKKFTSLIGSYHPQKIKEAKRLLARKVNRFSPRVHTMRKNETWRGQVIVFNQERISDGFFDLSHIHWLRVCRLGNYIRTIRREHNHTLKDLSSVINERSSMLSKYELNTTSLPISVLLKIFSFYSQSITDLLIKEPKLHLRSGHSTCQIATQPSSAFLQLLHGLQLKRRDYFQIIGHPTLSLEQYKKELRDYFKIRINDSKIYNSILGNFVRTYFILRD